MAKLQTRNASEQLADYLKAELEARRWAMEMPGVQCLAKQIGVSRKTVETALKSLEAEGFLISQGPGRKRLISETIGKTGKSLRIAIQTFEDKDSYLLPFQEALENNGHQSFKTKKTLQDLKFDVKKFASTLDQYDADGWIIRAGSYDILKYLADNNIPAFASAGRFGSIPNICGSKPDVSKVIAKATNRLFDLGHRRIVFITRHIHRSPSPGRVVNSFIVECKRNGLPIGDYNLPDWEENALGFNSMLNSLFQLTRPTAIISGETVFHLAVQQFLGNKGLRVPEDISLICADHEPFFEYCIPSLARIEFNNQVMVGQMMKWVNDLCVGKPHHKHYFNEAKFIEGGTVGVAPKL